MRRIRRARGPTPIKRTQSDEWTEQRRYMGAEVLERCRKVGSAHTIEGNQGTETTLVPLAA